MFIMNTMSIKKKFIILTLSLLIIATPLAVWAAGLVPCGVSENNLATVIDETAPCSLCHRAKGFGIIKTTIIGLAIMFAGWVLINEALLFFTNSTGTTTSGTSASQIKFINNPWNQVTCLPLSQ